MRKNSFDHIGKVILSGKQYDAWISPEINALKTYPLGVIGLLATEPLTNFTKMMILGYLKSFYREKEIIE